MAEGQKLTFFEKKQTVCPVCNAKFFREDLLSGGGRLIAGNLTKELRRQYDASKKYGEVRPLLYPITVCPVCYFATFPQDFDALPETHLKQAEVNAGGEGADVFDGPHSRHGPDDRPDAADAAGHGPYLGPDRGRRRRHGRPGR